MQIILALLSRYRKSLPDDIFPHPIELICNSVVDDFCCCRGEGYTHCIFFQNLAQQTPDGIETWRCFAFVNFQCSIKLEIPSLSVFVQLNFYEIPWINAWLESVYTAVSVWNCDRHNSSNLISRGELKTIRVCSMYIVYTAVRRIRPLKSRMLISFPIQS